MMCSYGGGGGLVAVAVDLNYYIRFPFIDVEICLGFQLPRRSLRVVFFQSQLLNDLKALAFLQMIHPWHYFSVASLASYIK